MQLAPDLRANCVDYSEHSRCPSLEGQGFFHAVGAGENSHLVDFTAGLSIDLGLLFGNKVKFGVLIL